MVHVYEKESDIPPQLAHDLAFLDEVYPEIEIEFITVRGTFSPELIERLSRDWRIPKKLHVYRFPIGPLSLPYLGTRGSSSYRLNGARRA